ncbi:alpha/beta fold hydrolase [Marinobacter sp.]|uniref:alpha/beta fold hydrolase n=1 Tax=Marinobacter sp. TaxID=50741 RepID=UPI003562B9DB
MTDTARHLNLRLPDGRNLSFSDIGTGENGTWIHCHGIPGSRNELAHLQSTLLSAGIRVIVPDRPGYGQSTSCPDYGFSHHTDDLKQLADHLQLDTFGISGFSGGGVFAMAAAHDLGQRIEQLVIAATPAIPLMDNPYDFASELTASTWQAALEDREALAGELEALTGSLDMLSGALMGAAGDQEQRYLSSDSVYPGFMQSLGATLEQGSIPAADALARDSFLIAHSWPFSPEDISIPVRVIHGSGDRLVYRDHQTTLSCKFPDSTSEIISGAHYGALSAIWS